MRVSAVGRVDHSTSSPVERVSWYDMTRRVRVVEAQELERARSFQEVMEELDEAPFRKKVCVIEVVYVPPTRRFRHLPPG